MDFQPGRDMLSELPLSIIHIILALVPVRDAVRTCILSSQWSYTWATLPHLVFEEYCPIRESSNKLEEHSNARVSLPRLNPIERYPIQHYKSREEFEDYMEKFITHVLVFHKGPIHKFKLSSFRRDCRNIGLWILCLSRIDIRELIIESEYDFDCTQELHSSIYSCKKLTKLELGHCELDPPPTTSKAFKFLRCLSLIHVCLSTNEAENLVAKCALLEKFTLIECLSSELRMSAPNLKVLLLAEDGIEMSVYAPLLVELSVELQGSGFTVNHRRQNSSVCNYTDFIGGFTNLEKLRGQFYFTEYLSMGIESCHHTLMFHHLKVIELDEVDFGDIKHIPVVARLVVGTPNLQKLEIDLYVFGKDDDALEVDPLVSFNDFGCAPNFKLEKLRVVGMGHVTGLPSQMAFIRFLLERSPVLERMSFGGLLPDAKQNLIAESQGCIRASPNAKLS